MKTRQEQEQSARCDVAIVTARAVGGVLNGRLAAALEALDDLFIAARPYLDNAAPHEQLFNGQDLRNFERLSAAIVRAERVLEQDTKSSPNQGKDAGSDAEMK